LENRQILLVILLDTHIWIWWVGGQPDLSPAEIKALDGMASRNELAVSVVSVQEAEMLERKGRFKIDRPLLEWILQATAPPIRLLPMNVDIILAQRRLPEIKDGEPADRLIAATALHHGLELATRDRNLIESNAVPIWGP
jgi:PIN domain nuclease of toxin-antitoxin system